MFQIDEKVIKDSRTLVTIQSKKHEIDHLTKNGTINYTMTDDNLWLTTPKVRKAFIQRNGIEDSYDKIVLARNGKGIDGNYTFLDPIAFADNVELKQDLIVRGNLTVEGETTIIDTPSLSIEDNMIELNKNEIGEGVTLKKSGTAINRGNKPFARYLFSDIDKAFILDTNPQIDADTTDDGWIIKGYAERNNGFEAGELLVKKRLTVPFGRINDSLTVANQATLNNLITNGNVNLKGDTVTSNLTINGELTANNTSEFNGLLTANRVATFNDNIITNSALQAKGTSTFEELATFNKGIKVTSVGANITGPVDVKGNLSATDNVNFHRDLSVVGNMSSNSATVSDITTTRDLSVKRDATVTRDLTVEGSLDVNTYAMMNGGMEVHDNLTVLCESNFNNNLNVKDRLFVSGQLHTKNDAIVERNLTVEGDTVLKGDTSIQGSLEMVGSDIRTENITVNQNVNIEEGDGKGIRFWNDENNKIYMAASATPSVGGRLDTTSDYNMYFRMGGGTNRGFVFKNGSNTLFQIEGSGQVRTNSKIIVKGYDALTRENEGHKNNATGINADKLDDLHATDFLRRNTTTDTNGEIVFTTTNKGIKFADNSGLVSNNGIAIKTSTSSGNNFKVVDETNSVIFNLNKNSITYNGQPIWHKGHQGHGSTLDADTLDGRHADQFAQSDHIHDDRYIRNDEVDLKGKYRIQYDDEFDCLDFMYIGDTF